MSLSRRRANLRANERLCFGFATNEELFGTPTGFATHVFIIKLQMDELVDEADC